MDEFHGQGGAYEIDPKTGARRLIGRTEEQPRPETVAPAAIEAEAAPKPSKTTTPAKEA